MEQVYERTQQGVRRAVVAGGSLAGLLAARVLSEHFDEVLLVDPEAPDAQTGLRRHVPQALHSHALLPSGLAALESLLPGLTRSVLDAGARRGGTERLRWWDGGGWHHRYELEGADGLYVSRPLLERVVRERVLDRPRIRARYGDKVVGLLRGEEGEVVGCRIAEGSTQETGACGAELLVDASGRCAAATGWLGASGCTLPEVSRVGLRISYSTMILRRNEAAGGGPLGIIMAPSPRCPRGGVMLAQEGDRWTLTLIGVDQAGMPDSWDEALAFARQLPDPSLAEALEGAECLDGPMRFGYPASLRWHYERLADLPAGLVVLGDALCSFNPVYGQGMSVTALQACALRDLLGRRPGWERRFQRRASELLTSPWRIVVENDLRFPGAEGPRPAGLAIAHWMLDRVHRAARRDAVIARAFGRVAFLLAPPSHLLRPDHAWRLFTAGGA